MKRLFLVVAAISLSLSAWADEGMWMLPYLQKMNIKNMKERGCKLSAEEIYSINSGSLKDAIVIFGAGCTGEIVSPNGLLFTNHHCGYGSIQSLSSVEHDYLKNGFWAMNNAEELPAPGLKVRFIRKIEDVTAQIIANIPSTAKQEEYVITANGNAKNLTKELEEKNPGMQVQIKSFFGGNQFFAFVIEEFSDVRLVGTPPSSIGKFGGDTDNWMWPRHTGDFSVFRVYAGPDNKPANYSPQNKPYRAENYLKVSLGGIKENDFGMIMGFPGSTQRYMTSYEIDRMLQVENPQRIFIRGERQAILSQHMAASDKVRIQYAAKYAQSSNYWKNSIGMSRGIEKLGVKSKKQAQEAAFQAWAVKNTLPEEGYIDALDKIRESVEKGAKNYAALQCMSESFMRSVEIIRIASNNVFKFDSVTYAKRKEIFKKSFANVYKDYDEATDRAVAHRMFQIAQDRMEDLPSIFGDVIATKFNGDVDAYVDYLYDNSAFANYDKLMQLLDNPSLEAYNNDPAVVLFNSVREKSAALQLEQEPNNLLYAEGHRAYIAGLMRMQPKKAWSADANSTLRLTYGRVLPYVPADGIKYNYYTTLKGVMEKEDPKNPIEFFVPERLKELYAAKDFGRYANAKGELPVGFLVDCDITGGNSGSPVMNAKGELIGLAFDGNWEAMSGDVAFEPELQRTIAVDVRYVLFVIDKFAGAGWLLDEMTIR